MRSVPAERINFWRQVGARVGLCCGKKLIILQRPFLLQHVNTLLQETYLLQISCFPVFPCWLTAVFKRSSLSEAFSDATGVLLNIRSYLIIMPSCVSCNLILKTLNCSDKDERYNSTAKSQGHILSDLYSSFWINASHILRMNEPLYSFDNRRIWKLCQYLLSSNIHSLSQDQLQHFKWHNWQAFLNMIWYHKQQFGFSIKS